MNIATACTSPRADRRIVARKARETTISGFERQVDPDGLLAPAVRRKLGEAAYRVHMSRLATKSGRIRRGNRRARELAAEAEALLQARSRCAHTWPDDADVDPACIYCDLRRGETPGGES